MYVKYLLLLSLNSLHTIVFDVLSRYIMYGHTQKKNEGAGELSENDDWNEGRNVLGKNIILGP